MQTLLHFKKIDSVVNESYYAEHKGNMFVVNYDTMKSIVHTWIVDKYNNLFGHMKHDNLEAAKRYCDSIATHGF